jgi:prepilin-type N-terminal cleavage/methylation domain-containing protein
MKNRNASLYQLPKNRGFTMLEIIIYIALLSLILLLVSSSLFYFNQSNMQTKGDREVSENARRALEIITYEISGAKSIYTPTTSATQLSLETSRYLPANENTSYIDFFMCGTRLCLKKEAQNPIFITSDTIAISNLTFTQVSTNGFMSIKVSLTATYNGIINNRQPTATVTSTAALRTY